MARALVVEDALAPARRRRRNRRRCRTRARATASRRRTDDRGPDAVFVDDQEPRLAQRRRGRARRARRCVGASCAMNALRQLRRRGNMARLQLQRLRRVEQHAAVRRERLRAARRGWRRARRRCSPTSSSSRCRTSSSARSVPRRRRRRPSRRRSRRRCRRRRRSAGVPLAYAPRTFFCEPVATTRSAWRISSNVQRAIRRRGQRLHEVARRADACRARRGRTRAAGRASTGPSATARAMIALRPFSALMMLLAGVAPGLVDGVIAATTPTGRAISIDARAADPRR